MDVPSDFRHSRTTQKSNLNFTVLSSKSIDSIADSVGYSNISPNILSSLAEDTSYRLRELIQSTVQILRHSASRPKLTTDDIKLALRWSDTHHAGQNSNVTEFSYVPELDVFCSVDKAISLNAEYAETEVEVEKMSMHLNTHFLTLAGSDKVLLETYSHYFEKISQSLLSTSDCIFEVALKDLQSNSHLQPLLFALYVFLKSLIGYSLENKFIIERIPRIFHSLMNNRWINWEPEAEDFLSSFKELLLSNGNYSSNENTFNFISSISLIIAHMSEKATANIIRELKDEVAKPDCNVRSKFHVFLVLRILGRKHLDECVREHLNHSLLEQFSQLAEEDIYLEHLLISVVITVQRYRINQMTTIYHNQAEYQRLNNDINYLHVLTRDLVGPASILIGEYSSFICTQMVKYYSEEKASVTSFELYWNIKSRLNSSRSAKWKFSNEICDRFGARSKTYSLDDVFDLQSATCKAKSIVFSVKNWKSRPSFKEKKNASPKSASDFAALSNVHMKPFSRCHFTTSKLSYCDFIL